ncbi:hypothetical protein [Rhizobium grahamii]|uniref:DUF2393 domain-containing protein n=1 Tax=Rhizobium grahamii TaxID=1120045 RepID=A0A370KIA5_9HYPH|nr:hypothetical protein [Rhizobium grahamii]RDJ05624.1 hypothetical protein B5K06_24500 [Rhizobium grahamii]
MIFLIVAVPIIIVCLLLFPRPTLTALVLFLSVGAVVGVYIYVQQSDSSGPAGMVSGTSTGASACDDPARTVLVKLSNASDRQLNVVRFRLIAKRPGYSNELYSDYFTSNKIIAPHSVFETCWALNQYRGLETLPGKPLASDFEWSVEISSVEFAG